MCIKKVSPFRHLWKRGHSESPRVPRCFSRLLKAKPSLQRSFPGRMTKELLSKDDFKGLQECSKQWNLPFDDYDNFRREGCLQIAESILTLGWRNPRESFKSVLGIFRVYGYPRGYKLSSAACKFHSLYSFCRSFKLVKPVVKRAKILSCRKPEKWCFPQCIQY